MMILEKIFERVAIRGKEVAIHSEFGEITYEALWEKSDRLAYWLDAKLKDNKKPVVVYGHKNPLMIVCFLACAKAGRAYCPVDTSMPEERIEKIVNSVGNPLVLATEELDISGYFIAEKQLIEGICREGETIGRDKWVKEDDVFYIIFTSGSSGEPKGVQVTNRNLTNFVQWSVTLGSREEEKARKVFMNQAPFSFDLSVMDLYTSLATGGKLWCLDKDLQKKSKKLLEYLETGEVNYWVSTPSFANMCLAEADFREELLPELEAFVFCGEKLGKETVRKLFQRFPKAKVINTYGPTECTVAVTSVEITEEMLGEAELPIGEVKAGSEIKIDNGEILILGNTVSAGYYNDEKRTEGVFGLERSKTGEILRSYRTGDEGYLVGKMLYYRGRIDGQVKLHGYRIELGDIDANLLKLPEISEAAVVARRNEDQVRNLVAFVVAENLEGTFSDGQGIRRALKKKVPDYMVPKNIIFLDRLPMTGNGKTDRKKLEASI